MVTSQRDQRPETRESLMVSFKFNFKLKKKNQTRDQREREPGGFKPERPGRFGWRPWRPGWIYGKVVNKFESKNKL